MHWQLLVEVVIKGLWFFVCLGLLFFVGMIGSEMGEGAGFVALLAFGLVMHLAGKAWQLIKRILYRSAANYAEDVAP